MENLALAILFPMISQKIRQGFLNYFKKKGHALVPSSPVFPHDDPTLLFINAGMNQFKDIFLGKSARDYTRATTAQKCIRVGGKHNDLENVGHTSRHLTFFEMLGNFSFGDYFKKEAIDFAWEVSLEVFGYDENKIWATVFHEDEEAFSLWTRYLPDERIVRMGAKDNFWAMGETGPCGPCSELLYDRGPAFGKARNPNEDITGERFLEFWNLVFMQFNRNINGENEPLPKQSVDTGAGLERVVSLAMGVASLYETDILRELIRVIESVSNRRYDPKDSLSPAFRVIADHIRSLSFAITDGVQPSNIERGYILRKILRRAVRYGRQLGLDKPFLGEIVPTLVALMGEDYPEIKIGENRICEILTLEEEGFLRTLRRGGNILNQIIEQASSGKKVISGEDAFKLKDTYGMPLEEIVLLAKDAGLTCDISRFETLEKEAKERSKQARKVFDQQAEKNIFANFAQKSEFLGYHQLTAEATIIGLMRENHEVEALSEGEEGIIFLDQTPFYAEKGGQVNDVGTIAIEENLFTVIDCRCPYSDVIAHLGMMQKGSLRLGDTITVTVDAKRRQKIANNHTATHLLHFALQQVLGKHIKQAGSIVEPERLRFDFSHHKGLKAEDIQRIEDLVNEKIRENKSVQTYELSLEDAQKRNDIKQFFGEKYGQFVRVVDIDFSKELCGGTHTAYVGTIGYFRIVKEGSISAGVRRIEAVTGEEAESFARLSEKSISELSSLLKVQPDQLQEKVTRLLETNKSLSEEIKNSRKQSLRAKADALMKKVEAKGSVHFLFTEVACLPDELKDYADLLFELSPSLILLLISKEGEKSSVLARVSADYVSKGIHAHQLLKEVIATSGAKGGGKPDLALGGGGDPDKSKEAIDKALQWLDAKSV